KVVTNFELEALMDTSDAWIQQRTGIHERRYVNEGMGTSDLGLQASLCAFKECQPDCGRCRFHYLRHFESRLLFSRLRLPAARKAGRGNDRGARCSQSVLSLSLRTICRRPVRQDGHVP